MSDSSRPGTRAVHGGATRPPHAVSAPVLHSATFSYARLEDMVEEERRGPAGAFYQRLGHPTLRACEQRLAALEGAEEALLFASGMAAISGVFFACLSAGDHVVALRQCYGGTLDVLRFGEEHFGWRVTLVDAADPGAWERAFAAGARLFHVETPANPVLSIVDLPRAAELAHRHGARLCVDATVASPLGQHSLTLGADLVAYSATKSISGHSDVLAGVVMGARAALVPVWRVRSVFGAVPDPSVAWLIERSTKTLALRVERANANALELARRLERHERVARVFYPGLESHPGHAIAARQMTLGFGPLMSFEVRGGLAAAESVAGGFTLIRHAPSLGGVESLASLPAHASHRHLSPAERAAAGIPEGLVRLSVGIEDLDDLWADLERALAAVPAPKAEPVS